MDDVMMIEYSYDFGDVTIGMVAMYNGRRISEKEVQNAIKSQVMDERVIIVTKDQYQNVFNHS
jgi:hypothetical protein